MSELSNTPGAINNNKRDQDAISEPGAETHLNKIQHLSTSAPASVIQDTISSVSTPADSEVIDGEERRFVCTYCSHSFTRKHNLKSHLLIHTREKPFLCSICSSKFRRLHDLKRHEKLHTGEKPYQCKHCGRKFARMDALVRHSNSQSGCTLLVDDPIRDKLSRESSAVSSPQSTPFLHPIQSPNPSVHQVPNLPGPNSQQIHQQQPTGQQPQQPQQQPQTQPQIPHPRRSYETNQWKLNTNSLPSINRLTPLMNTLDSENAQQKQQQQQQQLTLSQQPPSQIQNFDLLPYVKLLESRIATLETKLSATETKLAQLTYTVHHSHPDIHEKNNNDNVVNNNNLTSSNIAENQHQQQQQSQQQQQQQSHFST